MIETVAGAGIPGVDEGRDTARGESGPARMSCRCSTVHHTARGENLGDARAPGCQAKSTGAPTRGRVVDVVGSGDD
ncbi:MAG: hypothetical protein UW63_C0011G0004 [Candidatus Uhrbacteria bacterium GW2011_GWF2_44_350]|uniref:Uncharacterized protein n=1 Tax=Candidatus Uhrbacteria bacterium GW2011_GWF2_44_350 TaxID=1619000 RepID=A0A0G1JJW6_9BACT|nr:MAG: hypothetical protein UW63_C0011G0004 [Candidatus Uhrbacteria bacterium GW2011_GWF2_44_350]